GLVAVLAKDSQPARLQVPGEDALGGNVAEEDPPGTVSHRPLQEGHLPGDAHTLFGKILVVRQLAVTGRRLCLRDVERLDAPDTLAQISDDARQGGPGVLAGALASGPWLVNDVEKAGVMDAGEDIKNLRIVENGSAPSRSGL